MGKQKGLVPAGDLLKRMTPVVTSSVDPPVKPTELANTQLALFQNVLCNTEEERERFSNAIDLWDSIPRYSVSKQAQTKAREKGKFLENHTAEFHYRDRTYALTITAARVTDIDGQTRDYYPSTTEELVEDALRKLAIDQQAGFFDKPNYRSGVIFTIYALREELKRRGHSRSYQEIILALNILAKSSIEIRERGSGELLAISTYLPALMAVSKNKLAEDPKAKWAAQFHPFVTASIDQVTYRQFNYDLMMSHESRLTRWLHKYLVLKCTGADLLKPFSIHYATVKRDSGLLNDYSRERAAIEALEKAFKDLKEKDIISMYERGPVTGPRGKLLDVIFKIWPSLNFVKEVKAANLRQSLAQESVGLSGASRLIPGGSNGRSR